MKGASAYEFDQRPTSWSGLFLLLFPSWGAILDTSISLYLYIYLALRACRTHFSVALDFAPSFAPPLQWPLTWLMASVP